MTLSPQGITVASIFSITVFTVIGDFFLKKAGSHIQPFVNSDFYLGLFIYSVTSFFWVYIYRHAKFSISGVLYSLISLLIFVVIGMLFLHESLSKTELLGVLLGAASILLLSRFV